MATAESVSSSIYQLKISLEGIVPQIWRRVLVPSDLPLSKLHTVIQVAMGWTNSHLHEFIVGRKHYSDPRFGLDELDFGEPTFNEAKVKLSEVAPTPKSTLRYHYDFGDGWMHKVVVEKLLAPDPALMAPRCLDGQRACPPEDCGGIPGYFRLLEILADPRHPEHDEMLEWLEDDFDAEAFDVTATNRELTRRFSRKPRAPKTTRKAAEREQNASR